MKRRAIQIFIGVWLALQVFGPLHYYCVRRDKHDERFAWRMFSPMRMTRCTPTFTVDGNPEPIEKEFHEAWMEIAQRGRMVVLAAMGQRLCHDHEGSVVRLDLQCSTVDGGHESWGGSDLCKFPDL